MEFVEQILKVILWFLLGYLVFLLIVNLVLKQVFGGLGGMFDLGSAVVFILGMYWCIRRPYEFLMLPIEGDAAKNSVRIARSGPWHLGMEKSGKDRTPLEGVSFNPEELSWWQRLPKVKVKNVTIGDFSIRNLGEEDYDRLQAIHAFVNATQNRTGESMEDAADSLERLENLVMALGRQQRKTNELLEEQNGLLSRLLGARGGYGDQALTHSPTERTIQIGPDQSDPPSTDPK